MIINGAGDRGKCLAAHATLLGIDSSPHLDGRNQLIYEFRMLPEEKARQQIDAMLIASGWAI